MDKEASSYIGNSPEVNLRHYDPVDPAVIRSKTEGMSFNEIIGLERVQMINDTNLAPGQSSSKSPLN